MPSTVAVSSICKNVHLKRLDEDVLYHLGITTKTVDFKKEFGDIKYVFVGGSEKRIKNFSENLAKEFKIEGPLRNWAEKGGRYVMFKVGPVLVANHGMGCPSLSILLHEILKLIHYAECKNVVFIRLGTSGGLGIQPGTIVLTTEALNTQLEPYYELNILGKLVKRPAALSTALIDELFAVAESLSGAVNVVKGKTVCANDFYEEQARLDGAFCNYTEEEKLAFLNQAHNKGAKNFEMESLCFGALCRMAGVQAAVVCTTLLDRLKSDQVVITPEEYKRFEELPTRLIIAFLKKRNAISGGH